MQLSTIIWLLSLFLKMHSGIATTFSADDPANPDPRLYCTNKVLNDSDLVVAHPKFPCGTRVLIHNPRTHRSVVARVEDRGPRHAKIDLSIGTTEALKANGMEQVLFVALDE
jgi:rare lipoprotein A (peptidoglycan hydrolase)